MENKHTPKLPMKISDKNECSIYDSNGNFIIETFETEMAEFIVTACNNYQALKEENEELKEEIYRLNTIIKRLEGIIERYQPTPQSN